MRLGSLGNYTALLVSGAFPSENLFSFVKLRDKLSAEFSKSSDQPYGMLVVKGISENDVKKYVDNESTFIAGLNMPTCFTISGVKENWSIKRKNTTGYSRNLGKRIECSDSVSYKSYEAISG